MLIDPPRSRCRPYATSPFLARLDDTTDKDGAESGQRLQRHRDAGFDLQPEKIPRAIDLPIVMDTGDSYDGDYDHAAIEAEECSQPEFLTRFKVDSPN